MDENPLSASIGSLFHELRGAATFILGIYEVLDQKLPEPARELWNEFGRISERVLIEIEDQLGSMLAAIDSYSPEMTGTRIRDLAGKWEEDVEQLLLLEARISRLGLQLEDSKLNTILHEYLPSSIRGLSRILSFVRRIRSEDLFVD